MLGLQAPFYPKEAELKGATSSQYGSVFGTASLAAFIFSTIFGKFSVKIGPKLVYNIGAFAQAIIGIIFGFSSSLISSPVNAAKDPYTYAYVSFAINFCATEYGIFRDSEAYENINSFMKDEFNMEPWQVYNLQQRKGFFADTGVAPSPGNYTCFYCKNIVFVDEFLDPACKEEE